jgi:CHAD domain-containing protein
VRLLLEQQLREFERRDPGVRLGDDPEDLHRYRVATRRSRALIRATRELLGDSLDELAVELKWLAGLLGPVRDLDVLIAHLRERSVELERDRDAAGELIDTLEHERARHRDELIAGLDSPRFIALLTRFDDELALLDDLHGRNGSESIAADELRKLRRDAGRLGENPDDEQLHALRKRAKHARYAAELAALNGRKPVARYVDALKELQDTIGAHQDAVVAEERLRAVARSRTAVAAGRLIEAQRLRREDARATYPELLDRALERGKRAF